MAKLFHLECFAFFVEYRIKSLSFYIAPFCILCEPKKHFTVLEISILKSIEIHTLTLVVVFSIIENTNSIHAVSTNCTKIVAKTNTLQQILLWILQKPNKRSLWVLCSTYQVTVFRFYTHKTSVALQYSENVNYDLFISKNLVLEKKRKWQWEITLSLPATSVTRFEIYSNLRTPIQYTKMCSNVKIDECK